MLKFTAMKIRELLWDPNERSEIMALLIEHGDPALINFLETFNMLKLQVDYPEGVHGYGIIIPVFGSEAVFLSDLCTESYIKFLVGLFKRYD